MQWREGSVRAERSRWAGAVEYDVELTDGTAVRALAYAAMTGEPRVGDRVLLNASALLRGLGTGGLAFVVAVPDRLPPDADPAPGHIVKARYTPMQQMFLAIDEQDSPHHAALTSGAAAAGDLEGLPVVVADLHSALPAVVTGIRADRPNARVVYVMTDGGALPIAFSRAVAGLSAAGWLTSTVTVGQAFGGDHEAVSLHSGLLAARHVLGADVVVVAQGPGNVGTGTPWGYSGVAAGEALNAVAVLGGRAVAALRVSDADPRPRHRGISHHSGTAYGRIALGAFDVPYAAPTTHLRREVEAQARTLVETATGSPTAVAVDASGLLEALEACPVRLSSMGRGLSDDPECFVASAVAGRHAASLPPRIIG